MNPSFLLPVYKDVRDPQLLSAFSKNPHWKSCLSTPIPNSIFKLDVQSGVKIIWVGVFLCFFFLPLWTSIVNILGSSDFVRFNPVWQEKKAESEILTGLPLGLQHHRLPRAQIVRTQIFPISKLGFYEPIVLNLGRKMELGFLCVSLWKSVEPGGLGYQVKETRKGVDAWTSPGLAVFSSLKYHCSCGCCLPWEPRIQDHLRTLFSTLMSGALGCKSTPGLHPNLT